MELIEATEWYLARSVSAAAEFVREIEHAIVRISEAPERYPRTLHNRRRFVLLKYPYDVVYRVLSTHVEIIAIAQHARRPSYWRNR